MTRLAKRVLPVSTWVILWGCGVTTAADVVTPPWVMAERGMLENHVQLTSTEFGERRFVKAGEAYFSPDDRQVIFQAIEVAADGSDPEPFYQMYVADFVYDGHRITGIENIVQLSPPGSSNTCGWFHPTKPGRVIFGSTIAPPEDAGKSGYQRGERDYTWQFPKEMDIVGVDLSQADGTAATMERIVSSPSAYCAECAISPDGRHLVYCKRDADGGDQAGDLKIRNLETGETVNITTQGGYDGGPFFSPDGRRLCYRSDRRGDDLLQIFVAELAFDEDEITGLAREFQLTDNAHVNWAPFWHPDGRHLIYTTSQMGHDNYEVFCVDADAGDAASGRSTRYGTRVRRITDAAGFDGLPVFDSTGTRMMWTAQRDRETARDKHPSQLWVADFVFALDAEAAEKQEPRTERVAPREEEPTRRHVADPKTGMFFIYDTNTHELQWYNPKTHELTPVTEDADVKRAMELFAADEF